MDKSFLGLLKANGVKLSTTAPARLEAGAVVFPVSGGKFDPTDGRGTVEHDGALVFSAGARKLPLSALQLKTTQARAPLSVKAGGGQLKLAQAKKLLVSREGFNDRVKVTTLTLSAKVATRLGKKLHLRGVFKEGQLLGSALTRAQPETITVLGKGKASLTFDPGILAKLSSLFVALNPIFPAEHPSEFTLPIFGGTIAPDGSVGTVETSGSIEALQLGGGQVFLASAWIELATRSCSPEVEVEPSPPYPGKLGRVGVAALTPGAITANAKAQTVAVSGATLTLTPLLADRFNEVFAKPQGKDGVFQAGEILGSISFTARGQ